MCDRCDGKGWYWRVPDGFNPFLAGGWSTARAMYRVPCGCATGDRRHGEAIEPGKRYAAIADSQD